jgi:hypothetical protein
MSDSISSVLQTSAEISVAFVGFASLVGVFYARTEGTLSNKIRLSLRSLLDYGLIALLACGLPLLLAEFSVAPAAMWRISSAAMAVAVVGYMLVSHAYYKEVGELVRESVDRLTLFLLVGDGLAILLLLLNAANWPFHSSPAAYLAAGVFWNVCGAALSFRGVIDLAWSEGED